MTREDNASVDLIHVHVCPMCGHAARREDPDGTPDTVGIFRCSKCGHEGPLNDRIIDVNDARLKS